MKPDESKLDDFLKENEACHVQGKAGLQDAQIEKQLPEMETLLAAAEGDWQSGNETRRLRAEEVFVHWAEYFWKPSGRRVLEMAHAKAEKRPDLHEILFRCFWRAVQTLLNNKHLLDDIDWDYDDMELVDPIAWEGDDAAPVVDPLPDASQRRINKWMMLALEPYCTQTKSGQLIPANADTYPPVLREAILFCCQNGEIMRRAELPYPTRVLIHLFGGYLLDESALIWLLNRSDLDGFDSKRKWVSIATRANIPMAWRVKADYNFIDSANGTIDRDEIVKLLWKAAEGGDAEAQCRQGEALLKDISLLATDDYQSDIIKLLWEGTKNCDVPLQCPQGEAVLDDKLSQDLRQQARQWFQKAAAQGHSRAAVHLGKLLCEEDSEEAVECFRQVAENPVADDTLRASAECEWGKLFLHRQEPTKAARHLRTAAQNNNRTAMELLALDKSLQGTLSDEDIREWCHSLLELTDNDRPEDQPLRCRVWARLGQVEKSKKKRAIAFRTAAEAGDGPGAYEWARCLLFGDGCAQNFQEAGKWLHKAWERCKGTLDGKRDLTTCISSWAAFLSAMKPQPELESITPEQVDNVRNAIATANDEGKG